MPQLVRKQVQDINKQIASPVGVPDLETVSTADISSGTVSPIQLPPERDFTPTLAGITNLAQNRLNSTAQELKTARTTSTALNDRITGLTRELGGAVDRTAELEQAAQLQERRSRLQELNNGISSGLAELQAFDAETENFLAGFEGTGDGVTANIIDRKNAERRRLRNRDKLTQAATLARRVSASDLLAGQIDTAQANIEKAVELEYAPLRQEIDLARTQLERADKGLDRLTSAERAEFQNFISASEGEIVDRKQQEAQKLAIADEAIRNGAPQSVIEAINNAESPQAAQAVGGRYIGLLERQQKIASINSSRQSAASSRTNQLLALAKAGDGNAISSLGFDPRTEAPAQASYTDTQKKEFLAQADAGDDIIRLATKYKGILENNGFENTLVGNQKVLGEMSSIRAQMTAAYKDAKTLGTLDAGLITLMEDVIGTEPTSTINPFKNAGNKKSDRIIGSIDSLLETTAIETARAKNRLGIIEISDDEAEIELEYGVPVGTPEEDIANLF